MSRGVLISRRAARLSIATAAMFVAGLLFSGVAAAHLQAANAVDTSTNPPEIRYVDSTGWDDARTWSIARWNEQNPVNILPDNSSTISDLQFRSDSSSSGNCGIYIPYPAEDTIKYYTPTFNSLNSTQRQACATHELGHALSLAHNPDTNQVMDPCATCVPYYTRPQSHDISDYHAKWGN